MVTVSDSPTARPTDVDGAWLSRHDGRQPRYACYPSVVDFSSRHDADRHRELAALSDSPVRALSLTLNLPLCAKVRLYCARHRVVSVDRARAAGYLRRLHREIEMQALLVHPDRVLRRIHLGGGTPACLSQAQMERLMEVVGSQFRLLPDHQSEYTIEIDPRDTDETRIRHLRTLGFNRISLGAQDLDRRVPRADNRVRSPRQVHAVVDAARRYGFRSISLDLIYGLPHHSPGSFRRTVEQALSLSPDRLSVCAGAQLPRRFKFRRPIDDAEVPCAARRQAVLNSTIETLAGAGYVHIGMDHFAKPSDSLALAHRAGTLHRTFQGYSTYGNCDVIGCGVSAISSFAAGYSQNSTSVSEYLHSIDDGDLAVTRGLRMNDDDCLRRDVIMQLICHFTVDTSCIEGRHAIRFEHYFSAEMQRLAPMIAHGLVQTQPGRLQVTPRGRAQIRDICLAFDRYRNDNVHPISGTLSGRRPAPPAPRFSARRGDD